jgi:hypothetical protein
LVSLGVARRQLAGSCYQHSIHDSNLGPCYPFRVKGVQLALLNRQIPCSGRLLNQSINHSLLLLGPLAAPASAGAPGTAALTPATSAPTANGVGSGSFNSSLRPNSNGSSAPPGPVVEDEADRSLLLQMALKCADVGHLAATWEVHHRYGSIKTLTLIHPGV